MEASKKFSVDGIAFEIGMSGGFNIVRYAVPYQTGMRPMMAKLSRTEAEEFRRKPVKSARKLLKAAGVPPTTAERLDAMRQEAERRTLVTMGANAGHQATVKPMPTAQDDAASYSRANASTVAARQNAVSDAKQRGVSAQPDVKANVPQKAVKPALKKPAATAKPAAKSTTKQKAIMDRLAKISASVKVITAKRAAKKAATVKKPAKTSKKSWSY
jgi:hypothetical protein